MNRNGNESSEGQLGHLVVRKEKMHPIEKQKVGGALVGLLSDTRKGLDQRYALHRCSYPHVFNAACKKLIQKGPGHAYCFTNAVHHSSYASLKC